MLDGKLKRRRFLADLVFAACGLSAATLLAMRELGGSEPEKQPVVSQALYPQRSSYMGGMLLP